MARTLPRTHSDLDALVEAKVKEAVAAREKEITLAIMQAKEEHGLCSEVEDFLEENNLASYLPKLVKVTLWAEVPDSEVRTDMFYTSFGRVESKIMEAVDALGDEWNVSHIEAQEGNREDIS